MLHLPILFLLVSIAGSAAAQDVQFKNLEKVLLLLPPGLSTGEQSFLGNRYRLIPFEETDGGLVVGENPDWQGSGFPMVTTCTAWKPKPFKNRPGWIQMKITCDPPGPGYAMLMAKGTDPEKAKPLFQQVLMPRATRAEAIFAYLRDAYSAVGEQVFSGPLASYPEESRVAFVEAFHQQARALSLRQEEYKDGVYLMADLGTHHEVFNTIQMNRSQRLANVFREELLGRLSGAAERIESVEGLDGIAFRIRIGYRNFVTNQESGVDTVEVYAPVEQIAKFANDDLTGQQFLDASIVRVNDVRTEVRLSED